MRKSSAGLRTAAASARWPSSGPHRYVILLALVLGGYQFFGRPFAYLRIPGTPIFIGEVLLAVGLLVVLGRSDRVLRTLSRSAPLEALLLLVALGTARLVVDLPAYGLLALRDAALWYYALLAFIVATLFSLHPSLLDRLLGWYARILPWFLVWAGVAVVLSRLFAEGPMIPGTDVPVFGFKAGDLGVHVAVGLSFLWLCGPEETPRARRLRLLATGVGMMSLLLVATTNRGGFVSAAVILGGTLLVSPAHRRTLAGTTAGVLLLLVALAGVSDARMEVDGRDISLRQLAENVGSLVGGEGSAEGAQRGTVQWRVDYWSEIGRDTMAGRNGAFGVGFGPNLADAYGYQVAADDADQRLRNAHNSHMTLFARLGPPGLAVWLLVWAVWYRVMYQRARRSAPDSRARYLASWLGLSVTGILVNAVFDPILEGPQMALWLWTLVGIGCASPWTMETTTGSAGVAVAGTPTSARRQP